MRDLAVIELDEETKSLFKYHDVLVTANNELGLKNINEFEPAKLTSETKEFPYLTKSQELVDKVSNAAIQLKEHYDFVAHLNPNFIPYWNQDKTFYEGFKEIPKPKKRRFFESYKSFLEKNNLEERIAFDKLVMNFKPFFNERHQAHMPSMYEKIKNRDFIDKLAPTVPFMGSLIMASVVYTNLIDDSAGIPYISGVAAAGLLMNIASHMIEKHSEIDIFYEHAYTALSVKAEMADEAIPVIKSLANS